MMEAALIAGAVASTASGAAAYESGKAQQAHASENAYISRTRAVQTAAQASENLNSELGTLRAALGGGDQRMDPGSIAFADELRRVRGREARIAVGNEQQRARDYVQQGSNARARGTIGFLQGVGGGAGSLYDLYQLRAT